MEKIQILDCTLRDGGYCNNWKFGKKNIEKIIMGLETANIDIIEVGFLSQKKNATEDNSLYSLLSDMQVETDDNKQQQYVCMINYGEYHIEDIPEYRAGLINGIRVAFHKQDMAGAMDYCEKLIMKGYQVYVQPMVVLDYTDEELLKLIRSADKIKPYAFYIVDSFGVMKKKELIHIYYMVEKHLSEDIWIGFHSHNNMQMSYANAQALIDIKTNRKVIIDTSIFGMGRGAGNLNTELFAQYLNDNYDSSYNVDILISIFDETLLPFYIQKNWGYSLANYLSAKYNCHPNYATYLEDKNTLTASDINKIFGKLNKAKKNIFDKDYIEELYIQYMSADSQRKEEIGALKQLLNQTKVLIIASGKTSIVEKEKILKFIKENHCIVISINADYPFYDADYVFVSNIRRYQQIDKKLSAKMIVTSNILCDDAYMKISYDKYLNEFENVRDNAALMLINFLISENVKEIAVAGLDGYSANLNDNYYDCSMIIQSEEKILEKRNEGIIKFIRSLPENIKVYSITEARYISW